MSGKWEIKKEALYRPSADVPQIVDVPEMPYAAVSGTGDPNVSEDFARAAEALYGVSYAIKMMPKKGFVPEGYFEYVVPPLEGLWDVKTGRGFDPSRKDELYWTLMIRQPSFVDGNLLDRVRAAAAEKKGAGAFPDLRLESMAEGICCQILHIGPFDDEPVSFARMADFIAEEGYERSEKSHHEIYLSDFRKTAPEKLKTILRVRIRRSS